LAISNLPHSDIGFFFLLLILEAWQNWSYVSIICQLKYITVMFLLQPVAGKSQRRVLKSRSKCRNSFFYWARYIIYPKWKEYVDVMNCRQF